MLKNGFFGVSSIIREVVYKPIDGVPCEVGMVVLNPTQQGYRLGVSKYNRNLEISNNIPFSQKIGYELALASSSDDITITLPDLITKNGDGITFRSRAITSKIFMICRRNNPINVKIISDLRCIVMLKNEYRQYLELTTENEELKTLLRSIRFRYQRIGKTIKKYLRESD